jgi:hypothetical protein
MLMFNSVKRKYGIEKAKSCFFLFSELRSAALEELKVPFVQVHGVKKNPAHVK